MVDTREDKRDGKTRARQIEKRPGLANQTRVSKSDKLLTLKGMVDGAATTARTVRLYETEQLICPTRRSDGGHRLFAASELEKLRLILDLRACGFSLPEIRQLLAVRQTSPSRQSALDLQKLLLHHSVEIQRKLAIITNLHDEVKRAVTALDRCARCGEGQPQCTLCEVLTGHTAPRCIRFR